MKLKIVELSINHIFAKSKQIKNFKGNLRNMYMVD
jgi:hypothetical protein